MGFRRFNLYLELTYCTASVESVLDNILSRLKYFRLPIEDVFTLQTPTRKWYVRFQKTSFDVDVHEEPTLCSFVGCSTDDGDTIKLEGDAFAERVEVIMFGAILNIDTIPLIITSVEDGVDLIWTHIRRQRSRNNNRDGREEWDERKPHVAVDIYERAGSYVEEVGCMSWVQDDTPFIGIRAGVRLNKL